MDKERKNTIEIAISSIAFAISLYMFLNSWSHVSTKMFGDDDVSNMMLMRMLLWLGILLLAAGLSLYTLGERRNMQNEKQAIKTYRK